MIIKRLERIGGVGVLTKAKNPIFRPKTNIYHEYAKEQFEVIGHTVWTAINL